MSNDRLELHFPKSTPQDTRAWLHSLSALACAASVYGDTMNTVGKIVASASRLSKRDGKGRDV